MTTIFQVDAFTGKPFSGNPAAVCLLKQAATAEWMQQVAAEMNLAETAFAFPQNDRWQLRWFTPAVEVDLCGHATLATSHVLWQESLVPENMPCVFDSRSGELRATKDKNKIQLDFPSAPVSEKTAPEGMLEAIGVTPRFVGLSAFDYLVEVETAEMVRNLNPDMKGLAKLGSRGVIVTSRDDSGQFDFVSRFFAPAAGIDEDPVTGSAHCSLGPYWMERLGKSTFSAWQASPRGGGMQVTVDGDRVRLLGQAVTIFSGQLLC